MYVFCVSEGKKKKKTEIGSFQQRLYVLKYTWFVVKKVSLSLVSLGCKKRRHRCFNLCMKRDGRICLVL
jgi:hypothetical protein